MDTVALERAFGKIGARVQVSGRKGHRDWDRRPFIADIGIDKAGEYFYLRADEDVLLDVLNMTPRERHLLLMVRNGKEKSKFLCGHDERHWFVAAIPESAHVTTVNEAMDALRPESLPKTGNWIRQGEWFFLPCPGMVLTKNDMTTHDEPLVRRTRDGRGGKPHIATECYRRGGETVLVHSRYATQGFTEEQYKDWLAKSAKGADKIQFQRMTRNATVFARGEIRHPDHKTLKLGTVWHEVLMNRENESRAMASMVFLD